MIESKTHSQRLLDSQKKYEKCLKEMKTKLGMTEEEVVRRLNSISPDASKILTVYFTEGCKNIADLEKYLKWENLQNRFYDAIDEFLNVDYGLLLKDRYYFDVKEAENIGYLYSSIMGKPKTNDSIFGRIFMEPIEYNLPEKQRDIIKYSFGLTEPYSIKSLQETANHFEMDTADVKLAIKRAFVTIKKELKQLPVKVIVPVSF